MERVPGVEQAVRKERTCSHHSFLPMPGHCRHQFQVSTVLHLFFEEGIWVIKGHCVKLVPSDAVLKHIWSSGLFRVAPIDCTMPVHVYLQTTSRQPETSHASTPFRIITCPMVSRFMQTARSLFDSNQHFCPWSISCIAITSASS